MRPHAPTRRLLLRVTALLGLLSAAVFIASLRVDIHFRLSSSCVLSAVAGRARVLWWDASRWNIQYPAGLSLENPGAWQFDPWPDAHFGTPSTNRGLGEGQYSLALPLWMPALLALAAVVTARRTRWAYESWECTRCLYDLRGTAAENCPECGQPRGKQRIPPKPGVS